MKTKIVQKKLPNKMPMVVVELPGHPTTTVLQLVGCGMYYENARNNGISHFLEHVCFKGTTNWDGRELMRHLDGLGAETNAFTSEEFTGYYAKGTYNHWQKYIACVSDIFQNPIFPADEVVKERGVVLGEYDMYEDQPTYQAQKLLSEAMFKNQPAGWQVIGVKPVISKLTDKQVRAWHDTFYQPAQSLLVVAGPTPAQEVYATAAAHYPRIAGSTRPRVTRTAVRDTQSKPVIMVRAADTDQTHICIAFRGYNRTATQRPVVQIMAALLGAGMSSRLYIKLREDMGAGYYVTAAHVAYSDHGYLEIRTGCPASRVTEVVAAILAECDRLIHEAVDTAELQKIKNYLVGHSYMGLESTDAWAEYIGVQQLLDGRAIPIEKKLRVLQSVTADDIKKIAKSLFVSRNLTAVAYGKTTQRAIQQALNSISWK